VIVNAILVVPLIAQVVKKIMMTVTSVSFAKITFAY